MPACSRLRALAVALPLLLTAPARADSPADAEQRIVELYLTGKLFDSKQYKVVAAAFADRFEARYADLLRRAYGADHDALTAWLKARPAVRHTFYTALDERHDKLPEALALFKEIWKQFPSQVEKYSNLAIATAVVWDDERRGVYDYTQHQQRTHSTMPPDPVDALGNFRYLVENEKAMEGRTRHLPWEFLVFVVDHRTPLQERLWAQRYYFSTRSRLSSWHKDVPYDKDMLAAEVTKNTSKKPHLEGRAYTLSNIHQYGGVCAMQADFAARVAKSVGIPSVWCWGKSASRGLHAWWMYLLVQHAGTDKITVRLMSDGRFAGFEKDLFYTGFVTDPQTGQQLLDRDLERRLWVLGRDRTGKRQSDLVMRAYPWLRRRLQLDVKARVTYLDKCLKVSPYNEDAWKEFARMARAGEFETEAERKVARAHLASLCRTFSAYPDFIWRLYDDLLTVQPDAKERLKLYDQAVGLFEKARRPDLACGARLAITEELCRQEKWQAAGRGLVKTIRKFPTEGRYIPKMTAKLQTISDKYKGGTTEVAKLYLDLVPAMRAYYQGQGEEYCRAMFDQAVRFYQDRSLPKYEAALRSKAGPAN
jgi:hypothetical protein